MQCAHDAVKLETQTAVTSRRLLVHEYRQEGCDTLARIEREQKVVRGEDGRVEYKTAPKMQTG